MPTRKLNSTTYQYSLRRERPVNFAYWVKYSFTHSKKLGAGTTVACGPI